MRGYLPMDREFFLGSLIGARDREFGVGRLNQFFKRILELQETPQQGLQLMSNLHNILEANLA